LQIETGKDEGKCKGEAHNTGKLENPARLRLARGSLEARLGRVKKLNLIFVVFITVRLINPKTLLAKPIQQQWAYSSEVYHKFLNIADYLYVYLM